MTSRTSKTLPVVAATARSVALDAIAARLRARQVERGLPYVQSYGRSRAHSIGRTCDYHRRIVLPDMRRHQVRSVQVARTRTAVESSSVLEDSREPSDLMIDGDYRLSDEMFAAGTLPTTAGDRVCSQRSKGVPQHLASLRARGFQSPGCASSGTDSQQPARRLLPREYRPERF